jgi:non-specific serine/threonine protein kinase/serine/threonine-protein kinase
MESNQRCPECGAVMSARAAPGGICPRCLLQLGFSPAADEESTAAMPTPVGPPARIGAYRILKPLGQGGMGVVYLAEQERPIRREVAIKLIKAGMDTEQVVARFETERQALALMDHPNIARVFDAGATERGRPYFVMEHVSGEPITRYCDRHLLAMDERLELFLQVCEGVQHAHQKGIIHRDIKPSNVLVALQDGKPVPKIIDFGVAKATQQRLTEKSLFTGAGVLIGTPEYMSPEQVEMTSLDIDTRTDVYSLGVLLYELLVGRLPFEPKELREAALDEIRRKIREVEPSVPSARVSAAGDASTESARHRHTDPSSLVRALRGDLDWITMKALDKDRTRRYASPSEFAADVRRHLSDEPVVAGPPSGAYRAKKFVRRHRVGVGFAALLAVVLVGFAVTMTIQTARIADERDRANQEARTSERVSDFLVDLFEVVDPAEARGNPITAREILDAGAGRIERDLADQPRVKSKLLHTIGRVYTNLGLYDEAETPLVHALEEQRGALGPSHPDTLTSTRRLAWLYLLQGRYEDAESVCLEALEAGGESTPARWALMGRLGSVYTNLGRYDEAESLLLEALRAQRRALTEDDPDTRASMANLANLYVYTGRYEDAEPLRLRLLEVERRLLGEDHPNTLEDLGSVANLYRLDGRYDLAEPMFLEALEGKRRVLGEDHPRTQDTKVNLAVLYRDMGRYDAAETLLLEVLEADRRRLGEDHPDHLITMDVLAGLFKRQGRYDEAERLSLKVLADRRRLLGDDHPWTLASIHGLAWLRHLQGRRTAALQLLREAVEAGFTNWGDPGSILRKWSEFDGDPEYETIVAGLREQVGPEVLMTP